MIYLNYNNLDAETQERLLSDSKADVKRRFGSDLKAYAEKHYLNFEDVLHEEAVKNLYSYTYVFNI
ncbi:hypothetical protein [Confluentibacter flavum]|uniref:Uncharacterized protein n=1 Tax=Confluentibacter flavum TaxID=1909700 RepID=A0A2N3HHN5_9FLAO|nr:hypothetical protein [Confluentibacter flavum]PKQ44461.1 hypothetical protein CSW08_13720 [Confluentibacter flavum]